MNRKLSVYLATGAASIMLAAFAVAAQIDIRIPVPPPPKVIIPKPPMPKVKIEIEQGRGPADRGRVVRKPRQYQYYPEAQVYFDPARQLYFFMQANHWLAKAFLPPDIRVRVGTPIMVELETDTPYEYHDRVRDYYPGGRGNDRGRGSYQAGFDDGFEAGYRDGYNAAYRESFEQGYRDGYRSCYDEYGYDDRGPSGRGRNSRDQR
jgi:hypothetical protein